MCRWSGPGKRVCPGKQARNLAVHNAQRAVARRTKGAAVAWAQESGGQGLAAQVAAAPPGRAAAIATQAGWGGVGAVGHGPTGAVYADTAPPTDAGRAYDAAAAHPALAGRADGGCLAAQAAQGRWGALGEVLERDMGGGRGHKVAAELYAASTAAAAPAPAPSPAPTTTAPPPQPVSPMARRRQGSIMVADRQRAAERNRVAALADIGAGRTPAGASSKDYGWATASVDGGPGQPPAGVPVLRNGTWYHPNGSDVPLEEAVGKNTDCGDCGTKGRVDVRYADTTYAGQPAQVVSWRCYADPCY